MAKSPNSKNASEFHQKNRFFFTKFSKNIPVTARSRSGLWLQTTEDRERSRRQSEIPQILLQLVTLKPYPWNKL